ncbi:MAG: DM13 domain-containing protein [Coleofasciculus sp. S288]|nr:DM13 domain-containing protein [Coleofasciculus sp. S288]
MTALKTMKLHHLALLALVSLVTLGCQGGVSESQSVESPVAQATDSPAVESPVAQATDNPAVETPASPAPESTAAKSGTFVSGEHPTQGTASIVTRNGKPYLELDQAFKTSEMGPDLVVILHRSDNVIGSTKPPAYALQEGDYVILAPLEKFSGAQSYPIPDNINLEEYKSAAIWCRKFNATFGAAKFNT